MPCSIRIPLIAVSVCLITTPGLPGQQGLKEELASLSRSGRLALGRVDNTGVIIIPFGGVPIGRSLGKSYSTARISPDGRGLVGVQNSSITISDSRGRVLWDLGNTALVNTVAVSPNLQRVAFVGVDRSTGNAGIYWAQQGSSRLRIIHEFGRYPDPPLAGRSKVDKALFDAASIGWSEDDDRLAFSAEHKIQVFDIVRSSTQVIGDGDNPSWAPDGKWIAYRSIDGYAFLIRPDGTAYEQIGLTGKITSTVHWSPDSQFILVNEDWGRTERQSGCYTNTRLVVYRLKDGASLPVYDPCGIRDWFFGWISEPEGWGNPQER